VLGAPVQTYAEVAQMKRLTLLLVLAAMLLGVTAATASADPGNNNPNAQYRTFYCDDGDSHNAGFVGASASFFLTDSTSMFVLKIFTEYFPTGGSKTFNYGIKGFDPSTLFTCWYTDPQGVYNLFQGFITPRS
jgi:hypothetical protein